MLPTKNPYQSEDLPLCMRKCLRSFSVKFSAIPPIFQLVLSISVLTLLRYVWANVMCNILLWNVHLVSYCSAAFIAYVIFCETFSQEKKVFHAPFMVYYTIKEENLRTLGIHWDSRVKVPHAQLEAFSVHSFWACR